MLEYTPDRWIVLEFTYGDKVTRKLFGGWYGGYTGSDSWKLNSGIVGVRINYGTEYEFDGASGSTYYCHLNNYGMAGFQQSILAKWRTQEEAAGIKIKELCLDDIVAF